MVWAQIHEPHRNEEKQVKGIYNDYFGDFGGRYVAEILRTPLDELERAWLESMDSDAYRSELQDLLVSYAGRPTPLLFAQNATRSCGGAQIFIKLKGLANTGAHKINNALGQALLAKLHIHPLPHRFSPGSLTLPRYGPGVPVSHWQRG